MTITSRSATTPTRDEVAEALVGAGRAVEILLRDTVAGLEPTLARICGYHFGWCDPEGRPSDGGAGKLLRARLTLLTALAAGADPHAAVPGAAAVELLHNFSLLHDDIMDGDERRRGRPAAWVVFGPGLATLAGDALLVAGYGTLGPLPPRPAGRCTALLTDALHRMIAGQSVDLTLEGAEADRANVERYLLGCEKTSALLEAATSIGAILAGADDPTVAAVRDAANRLGLSWQIANDVEDLCGSPSVTGKPARGDLRRSKRTIPVILALRSGTPAGNQLAEALASPDPGPRSGTDPSAVLAALITAAGGTAGARDLSDRYLREAVAHLDRVPLLPGPRRDLARMFTMIVTPSGPTPSGPTPSGATPVTPR